MANSVSSNRNSRLSRRDFLRQTSLAAGAGITTAALASAGSGVSIIIDPSDKIASSAPARWGLAELEQALKAKGITVRKQRTLTEVPRADFWIAVAGSKSSIARRVLASVGAKMPPVAESLGIVPGDAVRRHGLLACGTDARGIVYALLELADRVNFGSLSTLHVSAAVIERPENRVRSINRCFVSDIEDKPWYNDRSMWLAYLTMLAGQRFNRLNLTLGLGYDYPHPVLDSYFYFAYPFLLAVPGYNVRAEPLSDDERDRNLQTLRYISDEAAARGLDFQLGLWNHAYQWPNGSRANYTIQGLTPETHAPYCRDALVALLNACPKINGITLRVHGESGIPEANFAFWQTLFGGISRCGRKIELNLHAKGLSERMIDMALATDMPVTLSPKYWAEHMGLPYQPASIRKMEMPPQGPSKGGFFALSSGARRFLRYSYGDLFKKDRRYGVFFRIWPGTQRVLLWGDPAMAASDSRAMSFCGSLGVDLFEPLSFKGRHGSGQPGGRCAYEDASLNPRYDWEKFLYTYRVWGRSMYSSSTDPNGWRRLLHSQLREAAQPAAEALAQASRILRVVTTARSPSAANNSYWPEMYTNMPVADPSLNHIYHDTLAPRVFNNVSPLDPELFSQINDFTKEKLSGNSSAKYSPIEVAEWLEGFAEAASRNLAKAKAHARPAASAEFRRLEADVSIQCDIGRFFAWKVRSGVLFALYEQSGSRSALEQALSAYRRARSYWAEAASNAEGVYLKDITYGIEANLRGNWSDRLPAIDQDIAAMTEILSRHGTTESAKEISAPAVTSFIREILLPVRRVQISAQHRPPERFQPGQPLELAIEPSRAHAANIRVLLNYRHVNQGEYYQQVEMQFDGSHYGAAIPAPYTKSPYSLEYFFETREGPDEASIYPGFAPLLANQPYFVARQE